jgi:hypothetical protein
MGCRIEMAVKGNHHTPVSYCEIQGLVELTRPGRVSYRVLADAVKHCRQSNFFRNLSKFAQLTRGVSISRKCGVYGDAQELGLCSVMTGLYLCQD